jgi:hypothetical protein
MPIGQGKDGRDRGAPWTNQKSHIARTWGTLSRASISDAPTLQSWPDPIMCNDQMARHV